MAQGPGLKCGLIHPGPPPFTGGHPAHARAARDGAHDVIGLSPFRLFEVARSRLKLACQNTGAIARRAGPQKDFGTFVAAARFPLG